MTSLPDVALGPLMIVVLLLWVGLMGWSLRASALVPKKHRARERSAPPHHTRGHDPTDGPGHDTGGEHTTLSSRAS